MRITIYQGKQKGNETRVYSYIISEEMINNAIYNLLNPNLG
nr:hypothetical protein [uncultured Dysgonomonas sp.]